MSVAPNPLLLNGKVLMTQRLSDGNNQTMYQIYKYGVPFSFLPHLNEKTASTGMSEAICSTSSSITLDKNKVIQDHLPQGVIDIVGGSSTNGNIQGMEWQPITDEIAGLSISKPVISPQVVSFQQQECIKSTALPSEGAVLHESDNGECRKRENQVIDLNKAPQKKPRRKKHRPKVMKEGKPARATKPATPNPLTPKRARNKESPGNRKYARKKKSNSLGTPSCPLEVNVRQGIESDIASVRRCLNFDSEYQAKGGCPKPSSIFAHNTNTKVQAQDAGIPNTTTSLSTKPTMPSVQGQQEVLENITAQFTCDVYSSTTQLSNEFVRIPTTPTSPSQSFRRETRGLNHILNGYIGVRNDPPPPVQPSGREIMSENLKDSPKVIKEGKWARTLKPAKPRPVNPKPARNKESTSGKRKYARKNKLNSLGTPSCPRGENIGQGNGTGIASIRQCLNFDSENCQTKDGCHRPPLVFARNAEFPVQDAETPSTIVSSSSKSAISSVLGKQAAVENPPAETPFDLNRSTSHLHKEIIRVPKTKISPSLPSRRETLGITYMLNGYIGVANKSLLPTQPSRRELIRENLKILAWRNTYLMIADNSYIPPETGKKKQPESNNTRDLPSGRVKRAHNVDEECVPVHRNFMHACNNINHSSESLHRSRHVSYFHGSHKRKRTENRKKNVTSNAFSSVRSTKTSPVVPNCCEVFSLSDAQRPVFSSSRMILTVPNNNGAFTSTDGQRLMDPEKQQAFEHMLSSDQRDMKTTKVSKALVQANILNSFSTARGYSNLPNPLKSSKFDNTDCRQLSILKKAYECNHIQESETCGPQICTEVLAVNDHVKSKMKRSTEKQIHFVKHMSSNTNEVLQEDKIASHSSGSSHGKKSLQVITSASRDFQDKKSNFHVSSFQDYQKSSNSKESSSRLSLSSAPHGNPVDDIVRKLESLDINGGHGIVTNESGNALVPYDSGSGMIVTYDGPFDLTKKHHPRAKVDIDPETNRVWNVLMGKESSDEKIDTDKEKWWEEERRIFCGRVDSFIARMHLIQGNRRFSQWKGSVVDSVVGVFLTQNVSDHLSSSAFMALAARFPLRSDEAYIKPNAEKVKSPEQQEHCIIDLDESINFEESRSGQVLCNRGSLLNPEAEHVAKEDMPYSNESLASNMEGSILGYSKGKIFDESPHCSSGAPVIVRGSSQVPEAEDRRSIEDVVSSQNSVVSSRNSSECFVQTADHIPMSSLLNFYAEDLVYESMCDGLDSSTSFLELLHMAETTEFGELYSNDYRRLSSTKSRALVDQLSCLEVDKRTSGSDCFHNRKGECSSMNTLNSQPNGIPHYLTTVSCAPSPSSDVNSSLKSRLFTIRAKNAERVDSRTYWFPTTLGMGTTNKIDIMDKSYDPLAEYSIEARGQHDFMGMSCEPPLSHHLDNSSSSILLAMGDVNAARNENIHNLSLNGSGMNPRSNKKILDRRCSLSAENLTESLWQHDFTGVSCSPFPYSQFANGDANAAREANSSLLPSTDTGMNGTKNIKKMGGRFSPSAKNSTEATPSRASLLGPYPEIRKHSMKSVTFSEPKVCVEKHSMCPGNFTTMKAEGSLDRNIPSKCSHLQEDQTVKIQQKGRPVESQVRSTECTRAQIQSGRTLQRSLNSLNNLKETSEVVNTPNKCSHLQDEQTTKIQQKVQGVEHQVKSTENSVRAQAQIQSCRTLQRSLDSPNNSSKTFKVAETAKPNLITESGTAKSVSNSSKEVSSGTANSASRANSASSSSKKVSSGRTNSASKAQSETDKKKTYDWDNLRKQACGSSAKKERSSNTMDSLDWEAVRCVDVNELSQIIRDRGMNNMLAQRIKEFLDRVVKDHGSIDLEWLRDVPPDTTKEYLLSIRGLGLKSAECVRLLTLHHVAFPVDTNVGRICVRLGWVPLQPLPESLQLHLLEMYPMLDTIQKYIWPRLCKLDQRTLYELHYQMITFGKVFCTKTKPNCNACPMRGECKHFASAFASARLALPGPEEKVLVSSTVPIAPKTSLTSVGSLMPLPELKGSTFSQGLVHNKCDPIIEEPATPDPELTETLESEIEDAFYEDPDEIPFIKLNLEKFTHNIQNYVKENNMELLDGDLSKALVAINPEAASIPMPRLKNVSRLRTEHQVYELPDSHPLLEGLDRREPDDPCFYLLAIWSPGETAQSIEVPKSCCNSQDTGKLCDRKTCFGCSSMREAQVLTVRGTLLIPCRTAMRGSFPLNGTYFQVNEVFADHNSSCNPISIPREWIWNLPRRTVYFGTSIPTIFKGLTTEGIQHCFWRECLGVCQASLVSQSFGVGYMTPNSPAMSRPGFVCVRGFDRKTRAPKPLYARLHFPASKVARNRRQQLQQQRKMNE